MLLLQTGDLQGLSEETAAWLRTNVAAGRPDLPQLCNDLVSSDYPTSATVFVCGPVRASERAMWLWANRASNPSPSTACALIGSVGSRLLLSGSQTMILTGVVCYSVLSCGNLCIRATTFLALAAGAADPGGERDGFCL
eukprot:COSAG02_NODE_864_length_16407_cov_4.535197_4_plen_139_part_00